MSKTAEELAQDLTEKVDGFKAQIDKAATKEDLDAVKTQLEEMKNDSTVKDLLNEVAEKVAQIEEKTQEDREAIQMSIKDQIVEQIKKGKEDFSALKDSAKASFNITVKAAGNMLTSSNLTPAGNRIARTETESGVVGFVRRNPFVVDLVAASNTNASTVYWVEQVNEDGAPAMTAEGAAKPQIDWDYKENSAPVRKIAAWVKASKEMLDDVDGFAQDISSELTERILLLLDTQLLTGDGTGQNLTGISTNATPFAAGALANTVADANDTDALRAAIAQVDRQLFSATAAVIHPDKAASMDLEKGSDGHYTLPPFTTANGMSVRGIPVVTNTGVGTDDFYVGDFSKYKFKIRESINIAIGYSDDDWIKNFVTPLAEMRGVGYIAENHYGAIVKGTFTVAKALLDPSVADA